MASCLSALVVRILERNRRGGGDALELEFRTRRRSAVGTMPGEPTVLFLGLSPLVFSWNFYSHSLILVFLLINIIQFENTEYLTEEWSDVEVEVGAEANSIVLVDGPDAGWPKCSRRFKISLPVDLDSAQTILFSSIT